MNEPNILQKLALAGVAGAAMLAVPMKAEAVAFIIDDFNTGTTRTCTDNTVGDGTFVCPDIPPDAVDGTNRIMVPDTIVGPAIAPGWSRSLSVTLVEGDSITAEVCATCQTAHAVSSPNSGGIFLWEYEGTAIDITTGHGHTLMFEYGADLDGANVSITFFDGSPTPLPGFGSAGVTLSDLPGNGGVLTSYMVDLPDFNYLPGTSGPGYQGITAITIGIVNGNALGLDANLDNVKVIPEPLTMLGAGTAVGFGAFFKRKLKRKQDSDKV